MFLLRTLAVALCVSVSIGELERLQVIITLAEELSLARVLIACKLNRQEYAYLMNQSNFTFSISNSLTELIKRRYWTSGSGVICGEDFGPTATSGLLSSERSIGVANTWFILHRNNSLLYGVQLTLSQRVFFVNLKEGALQESYQNGKGVNNELGSLLCLRKVLLSESLKPVRRSVFFHQNVTTTLSRRSENFHGLLLNAMTEEYPPTYFKIGEIFPINVSMCVKFSFVVDPTKSYKEVRMPSGEAANLIPLPATHGVVSSLLHYLGWVEVTWI